MFHAVHTCFFFDLTTSYVLDQPDFLFPVILTALQVDRQWNIKLCDFGQSRVKDVALTHTGNRGTGTLSDISIFDLDLIYTIFMWTCLWIFSENDCLVLWTAPEMLEGTHYDMSVDIFSYGIVLWEIVTRHPPYQEYQGNPITVAVNVIRGVRPQIPASIPVSIQQLLRACFGEVCCGLVVYIDRTVVKFVLQLLLFVSNEHPAFQDVDMFPCVCVTDVADVMCSLQDVPRPPSWYSFGRTRMYFRPR